MSWVNDLASVAGIPAGAATLAVAMYAACAAAEDAARSKSSDQPLPTVQTAPDARSVSRPPVRRMRSLSRHDLSWLFRHRYDDIASIKLPLRCVCGSRRSQISVTGETYRQ